MKPADPTLKVFKSLHGEPMRILVEYVNDYLEQGISFELFCSKVTPLLGDAGFSPEEIKHFLENFG